MISLEVALRRIHGQLLEAGVQFAVVGGLAVSVRTEPRFTRDVDLAVAVADDEEAEALVLQLGASGYRLEAALEHDAAGRLATVRVSLGSDVASPIVDLLFASSGIETEVVASAQLLEVLPGLKIRVATTGHLIALKVLARDDIRRPQDAGDLRALLQEASAAELERAREALVLITARGYHRGRDLLAALAELISQRP